MEVTLWFWRPALLLGSQGPGRSEVSTLHCWLQNLLQLLGAALSCPAHSWNGVCEPQVGPW